MKAAVLYQRREPMVIEEIRLVDPGPGEVEIRLVASGVCHSDYSHWSRDTWSQLPLVLGHEGAGVVERVGPGVTRVKPGDHVIIAFGTRCGECFFCTHNEPWLCTPDQTPTTHMFKGDQPLNQFTFVGTFAARTVVSEKNCVRIRDDAPLDVASLVACGVTTGIGAVINTAQVEPGANVAVIGTGGVGLNAVQGARLAGAARVIAIDLLDNKLEFAREFGATHLVNSSREDPVAAVQRITGGLGADYAFEVIGLGKTIRQAYDMVRKGGAAVVVGVAREDDEVTFPAPLLMRTGKRILGCNYGSTRPNVDFPKIIDLYMEGRIKLKELISRRFQLEEINEAFRALHAGEVARGIVEYG
jgi:S-(hydroxymethyl)glutathione dehydrogenase/alcohol dehydrogenase